MRVAIASDHHGVQLKGALVTSLEDNGHTVVDLGPTDDTAVDYPDYAEQVSSQVVQGAVERGILICGSGIGMSIAANKFRGIRAALCHDVESALLSRQHNDSNVICLAGKHVDTVTNQLIVEAWMTADFEGGRHARRVNKIQQLEQKNPC